MRSGLLLSACRSQAGRVLAIAAPIPPCSLSFVLFSSPARPLAPRLPRSSLLGSSGGARQAERAGNSGLRSR
jgi:hypothetical protein